MSTEGLFPSEAVAADTLMAHSESLYSYTARTDRQPVARIREVLEEWFRLVPASAADDVRGRFRSGEDGAFLSAFWELYVARMWTHLGCSIEWHPQLAHTAKKPDFRVTTPTGDAMYIEAVAVGTPATTVSEQRRVKRLLDQINSFPVQPFLLTMFPTAIGPGDLPIAPLRSAVQRWLASPPKPSTPPVVGEPLPESEPFSYVHDGWELVFTVMSTAASTDGQALGMFASTVGGEIDNISPLRRVLVRKSSDYGDLDKPLIVAALHNGSVISPGIRHVVTALWGSTADENGAYRLLEMTRDTSRIQCPSLWRGLGGRRGSRISAVMVGLGLVPWNMANDQPQVWVNDQPAHPALHIPPVGKWENRNGTVTYRQSSLTIEAMMGLPPGWPGWEDET